VELLINILTFLAPIVTAIVGWVLGKRKTNAEATTSEMENVEKALKIYREIITDLDEKIKRLEERVVGFQIRLSELEAENNKLKRQ
jgi:predicted RNase H-like nuclease (RuvC/YqgF family)